MNNIFRYRLTMLAVISFLMMNTASNAAALSTMRIAQFSNHHVAVWETIIYPNVNQVLQMHRHEHDRVVVALSDGLLKVTNDKGKAHYLKLKKNKAYYLAKDTPHELHNDQNISGHPIKVMVIELNAT